MHIWDIDFLGGMNPPQKPQVVYLYQPGSALLLNRIKKSIFDWAASSGMFVTDEPETAFLEQVATEVSLLGADLVFRNIENVKSGREGKRDIENGMAWLVDKPDRPVFLTASIGGGATRCNHWDRFLSNAFVIEEITVTEEHLPSVVDFFVSDCDFYAFQKLANLNEFTRSFRPIVAESSFLLTEFDQIFREAVFSMIDMDANQFLSGAGDRDADGFPTGTSSLPRNLEVFLTEKSEAAFKALIVCVDELLCRRGDSNVAVVARLKKVTARLVRRERHFDILFWACLILGWEERLLGGPLPIAFDQLCRFYQSVCKTKKLERAFEGLWGVIIKRIAIGSDETSETDPADEAMLAALKEVLFDETVHLDSWANELRDIFRIVSFGETQNVLARHG